MKYDSSFSFNREVDKLIDCLDQAEREGSVESYTYIKNVLAPMAVSLPIFNIPSGHRLARSRLHLNSEEFYNSVQELSYIKDISIVKSFGRANEPGQSIFYCSTDPYTARIETSEITRKNTDKEWELTTTGAWEIQNNLRVVHILTNDNIRGVNSMFDSLSINLEALVEEENTDEAKAVHKFLNYISEKFTKQSIKVPHDYMISCAFTQCVFSQLPNVDGILFPSTMLRDRGVNLALKPRSVDNKLTFIGARRGRLVGFGSGDYVEKEVIDSKSYDNKGMLHWQ